MSSLIKSPTACSRATGTEFSSEITSSVLSLEFDVNGVGAWTVVIGIAGMRGKVGGHVQLQALEKESQDWQRG